MDNQQIADFLDGLLERQRDDSDCLVLDGYEQDEIAAFAKDIRAVPPNTQDGLPEALAQAAEALIWASGAFRTEEEAFAWQKVGQPVVDRLRALRGEPDGPYGTQEGDE